MSATISLKKPMARSSNVALDLIQVVLVIAAFLFFVGMTHLFLNRQPAAERVKDGLSSHTPMMQQYWKRSHADRMTAGFEMIVV